METRQPDWELIANLGDSSPVDYGGYFVYRDRTGVYEAEGEILLSPDTDNGTWYVYRFSLDRLKLHFTGRGEECFLVPFGYDSTWPHPVAEYQEWFADDLAKVATFQGLTESDLQLLLCSVFPVDRAQGYRAIGEYFGWENLDSYPLEFRDRAEVEARYREVSK